MLVREHFRPTGNPVADPANVLMGDGYRITLLTDGLVRLEWSASGEFEDRASQAVVDRAFPSTEFQVVETDDRLTVHTARLQLVYDKRPFSTEGLSVQAKGGFRSDRSVWRFGLPTVNLGGTARTLDDVDGPVPLEPGILARDGVTCSTTRGRCCSTDDGWIAPRRPDSLDLYVFAYGHDYRAALRAFYRLTGPQPLLPRFALGNWWSRYHAYSADEYLGLMDRFAAEGIPLSVAVLDMDWHLVDIDPAPRQRLDRLHLEPRAVPRPAGVPRRPARARAARRRSTCTRPRACTPTRSATRRSRGGWASIPTASYRSPSTPRTRRSWRPTSRSCTIRARPRASTSGGWTGSRAGSPACPGWTRCGCSTTSTSSTPAPRPDGTAKRPLTFSRYAGVGSHRYPIGFSGDTVITWASLDFQPYFTATASNVGYGWWSHDVGGHFFGYKDDELAVRWTQFGVFAPITRLHSSDSPFNTREPWRYGERARRVMTGFLRLRHRLVPYLYTMNRRAHVEGEPLVQPMYYAHPDDADAYRVRNQYLFGDRLLVAPITTPVDRATGLRRGAGMAPAGPVDRRVHRRDLPRRHDDPAPPRPRHDPRARALPARSCRWRPTRSRVSPTRKRWSCGCTRARTGSSPSPKIRTTSAGPSPGSRSRATSCASIPSRASTAPFRRRAAMTSCSAGSPASRRSRSTASSSRPSRVRCRRGSSARADRPR